MKQQTIGKLRVGIGVDPKELNTGLSRAKRAMRSFGKLASVTGAVAAAGFAAVTASLTGMATSGLAFVDSQAKMARAVDGTIDGLRALQIAASDAGVDNIDADVGKLGKRLAEAAREGIGPAHEALEVLGLRASDLMALDVDERVAVIADRVQSLGLSAQQAADLLKEFGIRNEKVALLMIQGGAAIRNARTEVTRFGLEIDAVTAGKIEAANDAMSRIGFVFEALRVQLAAQLAPVLLTIAERFQSMNDKGGPLQAGITRIAESFGGLIDKVTSPDFINAATTFGVTLVDAVSALSDFIVGLATHAELAGTAMIALGAAMVFFTGPIGAAVALVAGGMFLLANRSGEAETAADRFRTSVDNVTLAMADEILQSQVLRAELAQGTTMSEKAARAKLEEARAHREAIKAKLEEARTALLQSDEYAGVSSKIDDIRAEMERVEEFIAQQEALASAANSAYASIANREIALRTGDLANLKDELINLIQQRQEMLHAVEVGLAEGDQELEQLDATIATLEAALAAANAGVVDLGAGLVEPIDLGVRLNATLKNITVGGIGDAKKLAEALGISLRLALALSGALSTRPTADVYDPRDPRYDSQEYRLERTRRTMESGALYTSQVSISTDDDTGGGSSKENAALTRRNALLQTAKRIKEGLKTAEERHADAVAEAREAMDAGMLTTQEYTAYTQQLTKELNENKFKVWTDGIDQFTEALFSGIDGIKDFVASALMEFAKFEVSQGLRMLFGLPIQSSGGGLLGSIFSGLAPSTASAPASVPVASFGAVAPVSAPKLAMPAALGTAAQAAPAAQKAEITMRLEPGVVGEIARNEAGVLMEQGLTAFEQQLPARVNEITAKGDGRVR